MRFNGVEFGLRGTGCSARFEAGDDYCSLSMTVAVGHLLGGVCEWNPDIGVPGASLEIGYVAFEGKTEIRRRDADNRISFAIQLDLSAKDIGTGVEMREPNFVADDGH
jgi:hypothetical protein